jgi:mannose-1-phosphate guanylyltransferase/mannose-6-phosphate isomerase
MYGVILAGGSGTRFWPKSREQSPKQLLKIVGQNTMIQSTVERLLPLIPAKNIFLVTHALHAFETCQQTEIYGIPPSQLLAEPVGKNTAAAVGYAAKVLHEKDPNAIMAVFPADHVIKDPEAFCEILSRGAKIADKGYLVTLGIQPTRPEEGYGYIKQGEALDGSDGVYEVERFVEKPDAKTAQKFITEGGYSWNCGVFLWKAATILEEIQTHLPELYEKLPSIVSHATTNKRKYDYRILDSEGEKIYDSLPLISIDNGILEKSKRVAVIPATIQWSDVGAWDALTDVAEKDADGNVLAGNVTSLDCAGSIIQGDERIIGAVGLKDLIVVDTPDALLVCDKNQAQKVKLLVNELKEKNRPEVKMGITVQKPWGSYTGLEERDRYLVKRIEVNSGERLSLQSHNHRSEHWTVVSGTALVDLDDKQITLKENESLFIPLNSKHRLANPGKTSLILIEVQMGDKVVEDDIIRYEDDYNRS